MPMITRQALELMCARPSSPAATRNWLGYIETLSSEDGLQLLEQFGILGSPLRWWHFLATIAHESARFQSLWENGNYTADSILRIFGVGKSSAAVTPAEARQLAGNAFALFERVYGIASPRLAHMLGNVRAGDGYAFRGLGPGQVTGRTAHEKAASRIGCSLEDLALFPNALHATLLLWRDKACNAYADRDDVNNLRRAWNGGANGLEDVRALLARARRLFPTVEHAAPAPAPLQLGDSDRFAPPPGVVIDDQPNAIADLQRQLGEAGFYAGTPDGEFMAMTQRALVGFQAAHGLEPTGQVDQPTAMQLMQLPAGGQVAPGRADVSGDALLAAGSRIIGGARTLKRRALAAIWATLLTIADHLTGFGGVRRLLDTIESVQTVTGQASSLLAPLVSPWVLGGIGVIILCYGLYSLGDETEQARVDNARQGR